MAEEQILETSPSQIEGWKIYLLVIICTLIILIFPIPSSIKFMFISLFFFIVIYTYVKISNIEYHISDERINIRTGIFSKTMNTIELFRIKDMVIEEPFIMRPFDLGNIKCYTSDRSTPIITLEAINNFNKVYELLRYHTLRMRDIKRVREFDMR